MDISKSLQVISIESVIFHERIEEKRLDGIVKSMRKDGILISPPIVVKHRYLKNKYLLLDGAHRVTAFKKMGVQSIVVQIIKDKDISLDSWTHLIDINDDMMKRIKEINGLYVSQNTNYSIGFFYIKHKKYYFSIFNSYENNLKKEVEVINKIANIYNHYNKSMRSHDPNQPNSITFRKFTLDEIFWITKNDLILPAGITKISLSVGRILNIRIPIFLLKSNTDENYMKILDLIRYCNEYVRDYKENVVVIEK